MSNSTSNFEGPVKRMVFCFNPENNGGEAFTITTDIHEESYMTQEVSLESYGASSCINIPGWLTPQALRDFANALDVFLIRAKPED
jgi:hypothetical protein